MATTRSPTALQGGDRGPALPGLSGDGQSRQPRALPRRLPGQPVADGFIQYAIEDFPVRILVLDTLEIGRHGGGFCEIRAAWLRGAARRGAGAADPARPPPSADRDRPLLDDRESGRRLGAAAAGRSSRRSPISSRWSPAICTGRSSPAGRAPRSPSARRPRRRSRSTSSRWTPTRPDDRPMIVADQPCFALHYWNGREPHHPFRHRRGPRRPRPLQRQAHPADPDAEEGARAA